VRQGVSARFELLPDAKPRWNQVGLSAAGQLVILGLALLSPMIFPQTMKTALKFDVVELMQPVTEIPVGTRNAEASRASTTTEAKTQAQSRAQGAGAEAGSARTSSPNAAAESQAAARLSESQNRSCPRRTQWRRSPPS